MTVSEHEGLVPRADTRVLFFTLAFGSHTSHPLHIYDQHPLEVYGSVKKESKFVFINN